MPISAAPSVQQPAPQSPIAPQAPPSRPWRTAAIWGVIILIAAGGLFLSRYLDQKAAERAQAALPAARFAEVRRGALERVIRLEGVTSATRGFIVTAPRLSMPESGQQMLILSLPVSGSRVTEGSTIVELDSQALRDHIDDVRDTVQVRENALTNRKVEIELASEALQQRLRVARAALEKARLDLRTSEVRSAIVQQRMILAAEEAEANLERLLQEIEISAESNRANLRTAEIAHELELLHVNRHLKDLPRYTIKSPMNGLVILSTTRTRGGEESTINVGDQVRPGQPVVRVVDTSSLQLEAPVNQTDAALFEVGQLATVGFDAYPGIEFRGRVTSIGALASMPGRREQFYVRTVPVRLELLDRDDRILPDMTAWANVAVEREEDVLIAPASAVEEKDGKHYLYVEGAKGLDRREVRLGAMGNTEVAILDGVEEGERVRIN
jgi:multidrug efflux pump subunit AcrA (membrane-fusion protein)